jgi:phage/plasmid-associated DNA primase
MIKYTTAMETTNDKITNKPNCKTAVDADAYEKLCKKLKCCYEVIPDEVPVCLYADIDCKHEYGKQEFLQVHTEIFIDYAKRAITKKLDGYEPRFAVAVASSPDYFDKGKRRMCHSIHIHIPNLKMLKREQNLFWKQVNDFMNDDYDFNDWNQYIETDSNKFFDVGVYSINGKLRSVYCSKDNQNRPLRLVEGTFKDTIISLGDVDAAIIVGPQEEPTKTPIKSKFDKLPTGQYDKIKQLTEIIDDKFICSKDCYEDWRNIVWALRSESNDYKELAKTMSNRQGANYNEIDFDKTWDSYKDDRISIGTLYHYAKISDPNAYSLICTKYYTDANAYNDICAKYCTEMYISVHDLEDVFKCSTIIAPELKKTLVLCKENWYVLVPETQLWKLVKEPTFYVISQIRKYIDYSNAQLANKMIGIDGEEKDKLIANQKEYLRYYTKINASGYITMCVKNLRAQLVNDTFEEKLDATPCILAFKNGVMDLKTKTFREGLRWDDFLTDTIPYDWKPADPCRTDFVKSVLKKILNNNDEHLEYYLALIGYSFIGMPQLEKSLYFIIDGTDNGKGDNGKTIFFDILNTLMPNYVYKSKGSMIEDGNAKVHKQLCMTKGKRLVWLDEFSTKKTNAVLIKEIADGKTIENEVMFGTSESINILYKMFILSNHIPKVDSNEEAVYNRYKQVSLGSNFDRTGMRKKEDPDKLLFIADCGLSDKLKNEYYNEIFNLVIEYAAKYFVNKLPKIPEKFQKDAQETKLKNDEFRMWFNDNCEHDESGRVPLELLREKSGFDDKTVKEGMKRIGLKYDKDLSKMGRNILGKTFKGGFEGCSFQKNNDE